MKPESFENLPLAKEFDATKCLPLRLLILVAAGFGVSMVGVGIAIGLTIFSTVGFAAPLALSLGGLAVCVTGIVLYPRAVRGMTGLLVDDQGVTMTRIDGRSYRILWSKYDGSMAITDERGFPRDKMVPALRNTEFVLAPSRLPVAGPIPMAAVQAIIKSAKSSGLAVKGWTETPGFVGSEVEITIVRA